MRKVIYSLISSGNFAFPLISSGNFVIKFKHISINFKTSLICCMYSIVCSAPCDILAAARFERAARPQAVEQ